MNEDAKALDSKSAEKDMNEMNRKLMIIFYNNKYKFPLLICEMLLNLMQVFIHFIIS